LIKDMKSFPEYMDNVNKIDELEHDNNTSIVSWDCNIDNARFLWEQKNFYNDDEYTVTYELIEGDFDKLNGFWKVEKVENEIFLHFLLNYVLDFPVIQELIGPVIKDKIGKNIHSMMGKLINQMGI
jgi:ribosome-associated toxin RatA of RatAB toxin-antitoxin module